VLRVDLWRFLALSLDCTAQTAFAMTFGGVVHKTLFNFDTTQLWSIMFQSRYSTHSVTIPLLLLLT
ncbi:MAG: hypothetical protein FWB93_01710, partial [Oscillospiraceae bacterium]|nr:hypothetical protein [Oscillospiraceae bacterium]